MQPENVFVSNVGGFSQSGGILPRPRLRRLLKSAVEYPLVVVYAGAGYGKTREVYSFSQEFDAAHTTWIQVTERDNVPTRFWENFTHMISLKWPEVGAGLREIGFPESEEAFVRYLNYRKDTFLAQGKSFMVYDDFHFLRNPVVLRFFQKAIESLPANVSVILISRSAPEINITNMMLGERIFTISEEDLRFSEDEIAEYFHQLALPLNKQGVRDIYENTRGWAFAINLIGRSLKKEAKYERYALVAMKENIFNLIEYELLPFKETPVWRFLLRISLLDRFAASLINTLADDATQLKELERLNAYIHYDYHLDEYAIHNLLLDYLSQYQQELTDAEKRDTYNKAGVWYQNNNYHSEALVYYEKAGNYTAILERVNILELLLSVEITRTAMEILDRAPEAASEQFPLFPSMHVKTKISLGLFGEASDLAEKYAKAYHERPETPENNQALAGIYTAWAMLRYLSSPFTDEYNFDQYFVKVREYHAKSPDKRIKPVTDHLVGAYALLIGNGRAGAPEEYIEALSRTSLPVAEVINGSFYGLDDLARGELYFFQRNFGDAEQYLNKALDKARSREQYALMHRSMEYLMLIAFSRGALEAADNLLAQLRALREVKEFATRYEAYDLACGHYYLALGQPEQLPGWFKADFEQYAHPASLAGCANRIRAQYQYQTRQYNTLLAFLTSERHNQALLLGRIVCLVLEALTLYQLKRKEEALVRLGEAYELAAPNQIVVPFTQHAKDMRTLTNAALKHRQSTIPKAWLEDINRKASAFAKRQNNMIAARKATQGDEDKIVLTNRETLLLRDLAQGLSRTEIAASQNISVNTVKMVINSIYDRLLVNNVYDALRVAINRKII